MSLAIDASSPPKVAGLGTITTNSFTTPANVKLVARDASNSGPGAGNDKTISGAGLTWSRRVFKSSSAGSLGGSGVNGAVEIWEAYSAAPLVSVTVASAEAASGAGIGEHVLKVVVITGADPDLTGAVAAGSGTASAPTVNLTTTKDNSWVLACNSDWSASGAGTAGSGVTIEDEDLNANYTGHIFRRTATTPTSGTVVTTNCTAPNQTWNIAAIEIREDTGASAATRPTILHPGWRGPRTRWYRAPKKKFDLGIAAEDFSDVTEESIHITDDVTGSKAAIGVTAEVIHATDTPVGTKAASGTTADLVKMSDRPAGTKASTGATVTSVVTSDIPVGARGTPTGSTQDTVHILDVPVGSKNGVGFTRDSANITDRPAGIKQASGATNSTANVSDRPVGTKTAIRSTLDSILVSGRPGTGTKAVSRSTLDSIEILDVPVGLKKAAGITNSQVIMWDRLTTGESHTGSTSTVVHVYDATPGAKTAIAVIRTTVDVSDRPAGQKSGSGLLSTSVMASGRPAGTKRGVAAVTDDVKVLDLLAGRKNAVRLTFSSVIVTDVLNGRKNSSGLTRSSVLVDDIPVFGTGIIRDVTAEMELITRAVLAVIDRATVDLDMRHFLLSPIDRVGLMIVEEIHVEPPEV